ncbi:ribosome biogenesis ATPase RIX7 [Cordyceps militaris]|uniref:Ribosome biogenesis ATPase RIX7 n=1 Tax=Cordyceps militaris TaxID=73501 RepID=A0A2H4SAR4_CORMI|nr:ribosome biogenesis ATPase RIX7 [Cordyceps militaris]
MPASLDLDVYHVVRRLEQSNNDGKLFKSVSAAFGAIKGSNSSLSRQKKRPLEESLFRVLDVRRLEQARDESDDSEAAIDVEEPETKGEERFLLNKQMTKHWNVAPAATNGEQPAKKKRRVDVNGNGEEINTTMAASEGATTVSTPKEAKDGNKTTDGSKLQKKTPRALPFDVESQIDRPRLGGLGDVYAKVEFDLRLLLNAPQCFNPGHERQVGALLTGPSEVGKSSWVRSFAARLDVTLIDVTRCLLDFERMEKNIGEAFDAAIASAPCLVYVEHIESCLPRTSDARQNDQLQRVLTLWKNQMQRIRTQRALVVCIATAARESDVHPSLLKGGYFCIRATLSVPTVAEREDILRKILDVTEVDEQLDYAGLAWKMEGYVGGDIMQLVQRARQNAACRRYATLHPTNSTEYEADTAAPWDGTTPSPIDFDVARRLFVPTLRREGFTPVPDVAWDQIGGLASVRDQLAFSIVGPIDHPSLYKQHGLNRPGGCLLWGPPGCGKTLVAQAVANEAHASFILINGPELLNKYVGESERAVRELFARARSSTPCILFFDEFDSIAPSRNGGSGSEASTRVVNTLLTELDGAQARLGVYIIATTNRPDMIDEAMLRPGRLSQHIFIDLPSATQRVDILRTIYRTRHKAAEGEAHAAGLAPLEGIARDERCRDFSGADLSGLHHKAAEFALRRYLARGNMNAVPEVIDVQDWEAALAVTKPSVTKPETYRKLKAKLGGA